MKIAYLISAHTDAPHLNRLVTALDKDAEFFVHIDSKVDIRQFTDVVTNPHVHFLEKRINVVWGSYREIEYQMALLQAAKNFGSFDYYITLSGLDYPCWHVNRIIAYLEEQKGRELLQGISVAAQPVGSDSWKLYKRHRYLACMPWKYGSLGSKFRVALREIGWALGLRKDLVFKADGREYSLYKGSAWWAITDDLATEVLRTWNEDKDFCNYFRDSFGGAETFVQTIAFNSPRFRDKCILTEGEFIDLEQVTPLTYIIYKPEIKILTEADYDEVVKSGKLFCRKTITGKSDKFLDMLDAL